MVTMIPTSRHLEYAKGYIDLGMANEASDELKAIDWEKWFQQATTDDPA